MSQPELYGAIESFEFSNAEAVAVWNRNNDSTVTQLISTGDLFLNKIHKHKN